MKTGFYCMAENGVKPRFIHDTLDAAELEAIRLANMNAGLGEIQILAIVATVKREEIVKTITVLEPVVTRSCYDDLPF
ncbi:MAG: hypothetical protein HGA87_01320 [Desulfobulbaceae bacterium]|nr:hypothetical protein [Desulfobulbaceae bacterium]